MRPTQEPAAHFHQSGAVFLMAAAAFVFGVGFGYEPLFFLLGNPGASLGLWGGYFLGFVAFLAATAVFSKDAPGATRAGGR